MFDLLVAESEGADLDSEMLLCRQNLLSAQVVYSVNDVREAGKNKGTTGRQRWIFVKKEKTGKWRNENERRKRK